MMLKPTNSQTSAWLLVCGAFSEDKKGNIYIGTWEGGLFRLNPKSGKLVAYPRLSERNTVQSQLVDSRGRLWIGTWENGIIRLDHPENGV